MTLDYLLERYKRQLAHYWETLREDTETLLPQEGWLDAFTPEFAVQIFETMLDYRWHTWGHYTWAEAVYPDAKMYLLARDVSIPAAVQWKLETWDTNWML